MPWMQCIQQWLTQLSVIQHNSLSDTVLQFVTQSTMNESNVHSGSYSVFMHLHKHRHMHKHQQDAVSMRTQQDALQRDARLLQLLRQLTMNSLNMDFSAGDLRNTLLSANIYMCVWHNSNPPHTSAKSLAMRSRQCISLIRWLCNQMKTQYLSDCNIFSVLLTADVKHVLALAVRLQAKQACFQ